MTYNAKNYTEQGGSITHFGGRVVFESGCELDGLPQAANQADSTATTVETLKNDFNALLAKLKTAGLMEADEASDDNNDEEETSEQ